MVNLTFITGCTGSGVSPLYARATHSNFASYALERFSARPCEMLSLYAEVGFRC